MKSKGILQRIGVLLCVIAFIFGADLFIEASQPCGSDGCLIHILYLIAVPILAISGICGYLLTKSILKKPSGDSTAK